MSKGDTYRKVNMRKYRESHDRIFGEKQSVMPDTMDRMRVGKIDGDGRRYLGGGCYQRINLEESRINERMEG